MGAHEAYQSVKTCAKIEMGFYMHLSVGVAVILFHTIISFVTSPTSIGLHEPMLAWSIAVAMSIPGFIVPCRFAVSEDMIEKEMAKSQAHS